ncbi:hypothetical protein Mp_8g17050 [Marchantia polymorpha subsp. ruderalis]|uniref:Uncharacterized protein n=1 Tax=Marchantia polymorpha TaxID=3197 RepID=A0A2R6X862_MARPO|nr:hypothetical protein MARPO_0030s0038 [Marchantia polymorpha]BBN20176.1 hypothetical protein Mp_8g17050 [Marchantia polymorpha subsp. ruderalis]|eukprot:PTQ42292.1 hypothetical protein MARPO_0030s0038 [Marchantia polymorpha]
MLIYTGFLHYSPYPQESDQAFVLVVENDFELGAPVTAMWRWASKEDSKPENVRFVGTFVSFDTGNAPSDYIKFKASGNLDYTLRLSVQEDRSKITVEMYKNPETTSSDPEKKVDTFDLDYSVVSDSVRTRAPDYSPARGLPRIRYFDMIEWKENLFTLTVPDNLCKDEPIWVTFVDDGCLHSQLGKMTVIKETPENVKMSFTAGEYDAQVRLDKEGSSWELLRFTHVKVPPARESEESDLRMGLASTLHPMTEFRYKSRVMNDLKEAYLCTLDESAATVRGKVLAGMGLFMGCMGLMPLGPRGSKPTPSEGLGSFRLPAAVVGALLAGVGYYDGVNDADGAVWGFLFPGENIERTSSGRLAFGVNSLVVMHVLIEDNKLTVRMGTQAKLGEGDQLLSALIDDERFFEPILEIFWKKREDVVLQPARLMKLSGLIPCYKKLQDLPPLSEGSLYEIGRGQIISNDRGRETLWQMNPDTLPPFTHDEFELFKFGDARLKREAAIIVDTFDKDTQPGSIHKFVQLPESKIWVLWLSSCGISAHFTLLSTKCTTEADVYKKMVQEAGYYAYMWQPPSLYGYKLEDLSMASITFTSGNTLLKEVFIPISGWVPWQCMVPAAP